jgi:release factor glutamine methyltransferase
MIQIPEITLNQMRYMKSKKRKESIKVNGVEVQIQPLMFPPRSPYSYSTRVLLDNMYVRNQRVLEIGTGCGILSVFAAKQGAKVDGVDILPECIQFSLDNAVRNNVYRQTRFYYSDMFSNIQDRYDVIICNLPILEGELPSNDPRWLSLFDPGFKFHIELFRDGKRFAPEIIMAHADISGKREFNKLEDLAGSYGWKIRDIKEKSYAEQKWRCYEFILGEKS